MVSLNILKEELAPNDKKKDRILLISYLKIL